MQEDKLEAVFGKLSGEVDKETKGRCKKQCRQNTAPESLGEVDKETKGRCKRETVLLRAYASCVVKWIKKQKVDASSIVTSFDCSEDAVKWIKKQKVDASTPFMPSRSATHFGEVDEETKGRCKDSVGLSGFGK